jgi:hypothetical protein
MYILKEQYHLLSQSSRTSHNTSHNNAEEVSCPFSIARASTIYAAYTIPYTGIRKNCSRACVI